ncbi:hypothetical protein MLD38_023877 [Melastoma candidum]|uniref:Uncharacterized protein n=1 Tax=Melastoma candidum TaxID=119954 RepID=A0ACB9NX82_9MYRT|nr:hypothetical protein MLD38_023877 [Melastoma candidum]
MHDLVNFTYKLEGKYRQTFHVDGSSLQSSSEVAASMVRFEFLWNCGGNHTCICRFHVHGRVMDTALKSSSTTSGVSEITVTSLALLSGSLVVLFHSSVYVDGRMWICGKGDGGRLGFGNEDPVFVPYFE